jgi:DnaJ-related protein SCJ1
VCQQCGGRGKSAKAVCPVCKGQKLVSDNNKIDFDIKPGMKHREQIIYHGKGETDLNSDEPGDVIFQLRQRKHHKFRRIGDTLYHNVNINFKESVLGFERKVKTLDGRELKVKISGDQLPVGPNSWHIITGEGMPIKDSWNSFGDLHIKWLVNFPRSVTPKQK